MADFFSLSTSDIVSFNPAESVSFFRKLLWAEAKLVGIGRYLISVPDCINVGDGGVDAYIENAKPINTELIPAGTTGFQIKSSDLSPEE